MISSSLDSAIQFVDEFSSMVGIYNSAMSNFKNIYMIAMSQISPQTLLQLIDNNTTPLKKKIISITAKNH